MNKLFFDNLQIPKPLKVFGIILAVLALLFNVYLVYKAAVSDTVTYPLSMVFIFLGMLYESFRFFGDSKTVLKVFLMAYVFSLMVALTPGKNESNYDFEYHLASWPYLFVGIYALIFAMMYREQLKTKLTEGITLLQSLALIYWIVDYGFFRFDTWFEIALLSIVLLLSAFATLNALTYIQLSENARVVLSVWSSIVMLTFAIDNMTRVFSNPDMDSLTHLQEKFYLGLQYFLLGTSAVYAVYNLLLLVAYLPSKNRKYSEDLKDNKQEHLNRFSDNQVFVGYSFVCVVYASVVFGLNYTYRMLPRHTMIWFVFFTFPLLLKAISLLQNKNTQARV